MRIAGFGFRSTATVASLYDALDRARGDGEPVQAIATERTKSDASVFRDFAKRLGIPFIAISSADLADNLTLDLSPKRRPWLQQDQRLGLYLGVLYRLIKWPRLR
mgnify:CR=1 FL=1